MGWFNHQLVVAFVSSEAFIVACTISTDSKPWFFYLNKGCKGSPVLPREYGTRISKTSATSHQEMHSILLGRIIAWSHSPFGCNFCFYRYKWGEMGPPLFFRFRSWNRNQPKHWNLILTLNLKALLMAESTDVNWQGCISKRIGTKSHVVCHAGLLRLISSRCSSHSFVSSNHIQHHMGLVKSSFECGLKLTLPSLKPAFSPLKMDGWNTILSFRDGLSGANLLLVSNSESCRWHFLSSWDQKATVLI